jgi:uncharacterized protein with HEPN domain
MRGHDIQITLRQISEACDRAVELRQTLTWEKFSSDWRQQLLAERVVEIIGEAVKRLPEEWRNRHPQAPWKKIAGTRDYIAHGYDSVDREVIWSILDVEAFRLKQTVSEILALEHP